MNNIVIVGCNFSGLYSAMKCIDNGIPVIIVEKISMCSDEIINYKIFNKNHSYYIQLLSRLSIKYSKYNLNFNEKYYILLILFYIKPNIFLLNFYICKLLINSVIHYYHKQITVI